MPNQPELTPNADDDALAPLCAAAVNGDSAAPASLTSALHDPIYGLALRTLMHPQDAEDATQEIAVRIMTRLSQYRGEGRFIRPYPMGFKRPPQVWQPCKRDSPVRTTCGLLRN